MNSRWNKFEDLKMRIGHDDTNKILEDLIDLLQKTDEEHANAIDKSLREI